MTLCWNLCCRSRNCQTVQLNHMEYREDAMCIYFAHSKNDQHGERHRVARHIYPNSVRPEICPLLALGVYWLVSPILINQSRLFPGSLQDGRFRKVLKRICQVPDVAVWLQRQGIISSELGTHSIRKGAGTYCSSGSTMAPSSAAINLRVGLQDTTLQYD